MCVCLLQAWFIQSLAISVSVSLPRKALNSAIVFIVGQSCMHSHTHHKTLENIITYIMEFPLYTIMILETLPEIILKPLSFKYASECLTFLQIKPIQNLNCVVAANVDTHLSSDG